MYRQMQEKTAAKSADGREAALQSNKRAFYVLKILKKPHSAEYLIFCESRGANAANLMLQAAEATVKDGRGSGLAELPVFR